MSQSLFLVDDGDSTFLVYAPTAKAAKMHFARCHKRKRPAWWIDKTRFLRARRVNFNQSGIASMPRIG